MLKNICNIKDENYIPKDDVEYSYIEIASVEMQGNIGDCDRMYGSELPTRAKRLVFANDVIISSVEGSLSKCALVTKDYEGFICTNGFYVLTSEKINSETLIILFKSKPIQALLYRGCSGTILSAISKDELLKIPIPIINENIQERIKLYISESNMKRKNFKQMLKKAIHITEIAIEFGETEALKL